MQIAYLSPDGDPLWFTLGKGSTDLIPSGAFISTSSVTKILKLC